MKCPFCGSSRSVVRDTSRLTTEIMRIRRCLACGRYWQTREEIFKEITKRVEEPKQEKIFK